MENFLKLDNPTEKKSDKPLVRTRLRIIGPIITSSVSPQ